MPIRLACLALFALSLVLAPTALAGAPGKWTQLGQANIRNIDEAALARTADGTLHAVWTIAAANNDTLVHDSIGPNGVVAPPNVIETGWAGISSVPELLSTGDGLRVLFGGIRTTSSSETNDNMNTATAPASGATWALAPGTVVEGDAAYASDTGAALLPDGTPLISWGGTGAGVLTHRGLSPATPNYGLQAQLGGCCGYSPDVAVDSKSGAAFVTWYSNADSNLGVFAQSLDPATGAPSGSPTKMPGSSTAFNGSQRSSQQLQRTPIAARAGGGVYVAYPGGYPTTTKTLLWRIGDGKSSVVGSSKNGRIVSLAADSDGRLWVMWVEQRSRPVLFARRSNKSATEFGQAVRITAPAGQSSAYRVSGNAQTGRLDVVALLGGTIGQAQWHTQFLPGLAVSLSPTKKSKKGGDVTVTVTDPDAVSGAKVSGGGDSATTNKSGKATLDIGATKKRSVKITVTKAGYAPGSARLKIR